MAAVITTLLGGGLGPAAAEESPRQSERTTRPMVWTEASDPVVLRPSTDVRDISCSPAGAACVAVGHRSDENREQVPAVQWWDGSAWRADAPPGESGGLVKVDCSTAADCVALEEPRWEGGRSRRIAVRSSAGWRWVDFSVATRDVEFTLVSCASPTSCVLAGENRAVALFDGTTVRALPSTPTAVHALSCPSASFCAAVGDSAFLEWDAAKWSTTALEGTDILVDVDCWAEQSCLALSGYEETSSYSRLPGSTWTPGSAPTGRPYVDALGSAALGLECATDGTCHLLRSFGPRREPDLVMASWAGGSWTANRVPDPEGVVAALGCRPGECVLMDVGRAGHEQQISTNAIHGHGAQWTRRAMINPLGVLQETYPHEASCPARNWCLVLGSLGVLGGMGSESYVVRGDGSDWHEMPAALEDQRDLDCWRPGRCVVAGSDGKRPRVALLRDGRWRLLPALSPSWLVAGTITGVGCAAARCVYSGYYRARHGAGTGVFVARRGAGSWQARRLGPMIPEETAFSGRPSVDCPTVSRCVVVISTRVPGDRKPTSYEAVLENGRWRWTTLGRGFSLFELDCSDAVHCVAGGEAGKPGLIMARGADGAWRRVDVRTRNAAFYSISCPTARECFAAGVGSRIRQLTRTQAGWRERATGPRNTTDIACSRPRACVVFAADRTWSGR